MTLCALRQSVPDASGPVRVGISLRRHAGLRLEDAVEVEAAEAGGAGQLVQARRLLGLFDDPAGLRDDGRLPLRLRRPIRAAALAGPEARPLARRLQSRERRHFRAVARRAAQDGRQKTPVVRTE